MGKESRSEYGLGKEYELEGDEAEMEKESAQVRQELEQMFDTERMKAAWNAVVTPKTSKKLRPVVTNTTSGDGSSRRQAQQVRVGKSDNVLRGRGFPKSNLFPKTR